MAALTWRKRGLRQVKAVRMVMDQGAGKLPPLFPRGQMRPYALRDRALAVATLLLLATPAAAASQANGARLAAANCAGCHAVGRTGASPLADAPPFRELKRRGDLAGLLSQGMIATPGPREEEGDWKRHPRMPQVMLDEAELGDLMAYMKSVQAPGKPEI